ncbi:MAG TPA: hypothetical protein VJG32_17430 [Anaerolineae bacterium]|nr:hypothetical protein [Anaerolineae bacterium]
MTLGAARDIALMILVVEVFLCALVPGALVVGSWWIARRTHRAIPPRIRRARVGIRRARDGVDGLARVITRPIFFAETQSTRLRAMWRAVRGRK